MRFSSKLNSKLGYFFVFALFFALRIWGIYFGLPYDGLHPTEHFSISHSLHYLTDHTLKPWDFQHPSLYQYLLTFISFPLFIVSKNYLVLYLMGRLISLLASCLSIYLVYILACSLFKSKPRALLCSCFLGFNLLSIKYSHYAVPDQLCLVFVTAAIIFSLKIINSPSIKNYLLAGLFCGLSIGSKFSGLISIGFLVSAHFCLEKERRKLFRKNIFLSLAVVFLAFFLTSPYHVLNIAEAARDLNGYLSEKGYFQGTGFQPAGLFNYSFMLLPDIFGIFALLCSLMGMVALFLKERKKMLFFALPVIAYFLIISRESTGTLQNVLLALPVLSIFAVYFLFWLQEKKVNKVVIIFIASLSLVPNLIRGIIFDYYILKPDTRIAAQDWLVKNVADNAKVGFERYTPVDLNYIEKSEAVRKFKAVNFVPSLSLYPASFYKEQGYDYIVTSSFRFDTYQFLCSHHAFCAEVNNYSTFDSELELVKEFYPPKVFSFTGVSLPWGTWPHQPKIKIYKVQRI